jgi:hypothetical protein
VCFIPCSGWSAHSRPSTARLLGLVGALLVYPELAEGLRPRDACIASPSGSRLFTLSKAEGQPRHSAIACWNPPFAHAQGVRVFPDIPVREFSSFGLRSESFTITALLHKVLSLSWSSRTARAFAPSRRGIIRYHPPYFIKVWPWPQHLRASLRSCPRSGRSAHPRPGTTP